MQITNSPPHIQISLNNFSSISPSNICQKYKAELDKKMVGAI